MEPFGNDSKANNNKGVQETNNNVTNNNSCNIDQANRVQQGSTVPMTNSLATSTTSRDPSSIASTTTAAPNDIRDANILATLSARMQQETAAEDEGPPAVNVSIRDAYNLASLSSTARQTNFFTNGVDTTQTDTSMTMATITTQPNGGTNPTIVKPAPPMKKRWVEAGTFGSTDGMSFEGGEKHEMGTVNNNAKSIEEESTKQSEEPLKLLSGPKNIGSDLSAVEKSLEKEGLSLGGESGNEMPRKEREMNVSGDSMSREKQALSSVDGGIHVAPSAKNDQTTFKESENEGSDTNEGKSEVDSPVNLPFTGVDSQVAQTKSSNSVDWGQLGMSMQQAADDEPDDDKVSEEGEEKVAAAVLNSESGAINTAVIVKCSTLPSDNKDECEAESAAPQITSFVVPPPTELPSTGVVTLRGRLTVSDGIHKISGVWALGQDRLAEGLEFEYKHQPNGEVNDFPASGKYTGWFEIYSDDGQSKLRSPEADVELMFVRNSESYHNIEGRGSNIYGSYYIYGTFTKEGVITMCRKFIEPEPKPRPKRTKKTASRRSKTTGRKRGRPKSEGSTPKSDSPAKKKMKEKPHPDAGKRYGLGQPGILCDCCFFDEETDVGDTPFIKCLYCGLLAHSACYPTTSTVDKNGKFLCDVCTVYFHPSVNKAERTKNSTSGNIEPPKEPLAEDVAAKSDGRLHEDRAFCQLCARNDVQGGLKPTDSSAWVHLACVMSTENAYFDGKVAVGIQGELKKNRTEVIKHKKETGSKPSCEECGRKSGMLLQCKHDGCKLYMHALCAEILDRCRVVTNDGTRDIVGYKCEKHSYVGLDACGICKLGTRQSEMIECDKCSQGYHMDCLTPPLTEIPEGDWFCSTCLDTFPVDLETSKPTENVEDDEPPEGYSAMDF